MARREGQGWRRLLRKALFCGAALVLIYVCAEVLSLVAFTIDSPVGFSFWQNQKARLAILDPGPGTRIRRGERSQCVHPYFGYVNDPDVHPKANAYGFWGPEPAIPGIRPKPDDVVTVALFGGSVANNVAIDLAEALSAALPELGRFRGKRVELHSLALAAMKQPQHLLIHSYFASLGTEFDVVILLDGFNEAVLTGLMVREGVNPLLPHNWDIRSVSMAESTGVADVARLALAEERRASLARRFSSPWLLNSVTANTLWYFLDKRAVEEVATLRVAAHEAQKKSANDAKGWLLRGPPWEKKAGRESSEFFADHWARCSRLMAHAAARDGAAYFHFLQPNQYVPGSRTLTAAEKAVAIERRPRYRPLVELGYPLLQASGRALAADGLRFHDLTMIYRDVEEAIYRDPCCHVNELGDRLMADAITRKIVAALR